MARAVRDSGNLGLIGGEFEGSAEVDSDFSVRLRSCESAVRDSAIHQPREVGIGAEVFGDVVHANRKVRIGAALRVRLQLPLLLARAIAGVGDQGPRPSQHSGLTQALTIREVAEAKRGTVWEHPPLLTGIRRLAGAGRFDLLVPQDQAAVSHLEAKKDKGRIGVADITDAIAVPVRLVGIGQHGAVVIGIRDSIGIGVRLFAGAGGRYGADAAVTTPRRKVVRNRRFARCAHLSVQRVGRTCGVDATAAAHLVAQDNPRGGAAGEIARNGNRSSFVAVAVKVGVLDQLTRHHQVDLSPDLGAPLVHIQGDGMRAGVVGERADGAEAI